MKKLFLLLLLVNFFTIAFSQVYTFTGNGDWSIAGNWANQTIPPASLPSGSTIVISPKAGDSCVLNTLQVILPGGIITVSPGAKFIVHGSVNSNPFVDICGQKWAERNLDVVTYSNGDTIPFVPDYYQWRDLKTGAWFYPGNDPDSAAVFGRLYNWYAVNDYRGLAPKGWHIPTQQEFAALADCAGGAAGAGGALKHAGELHWWAPNTGATNSTGFTGLPAGYLDANYFSVGETACWWSATEDSSKGAFYTRLYNNDSVMSMFYSDQKMIGLSVRCLQGGIPVTVTGSLSDLTSTSVVTGGNITEDGGSPIISKGIIWSKYPNPTVDLNTKTNEGAGSGSFISQLNNLRPLVKYYIRSYATNVNGTAYGKDTFFTTHVPESLPPDTMICGKRWMTRNLTVSNYRNGDPIPQVTDLNQWMSLTTGAWCWYNNDSVTYGAIYGKLYNWYAVHDPRGLAPQGWHVPSDTEFHQLTACLGNDVIAVMKLRESGTDHWVAEDSANNSSGFTGLPGGITHSFGSSFGEVGYSGHWWSATELLPPYLPGYAWLMVLRAHPNNEPDQVIISTIKERGLSVRCVKD